MITLRALRFAIVIGYTAVGLGVAFHLVGLYAAVIAPLIAYVVLSLLSDWIMLAGEQRRLTTSIMQTGAAALTSEMIDGTFRLRAPTVIDDDPQWGKLVEGRETVFNQTLTAVQVVNSTPEPDGSYKKVWLRVPSRGARQGTRVCIQSGCNKDIAWPPRTAKEAIAWTFRLCVDHYIPKKAS